MPPTTSPAVIKASPLVNEGGLVHRSRARGLLNADNLPALQNLLKRQPHAYVEEFSSQWNHYQSLRSIFASELDAPNLAIASTGVRINKDQANKFVSLISFVTQLAPSYPEITKQLPFHLSDLLLNHHAALSPDIRASCLRSLILLRNRDVITSEQLLHTLFPLLSVTTSAAVRTSVQATILQDIKNANAKSKNHRLNRVVQGLLFGIVQKAIDASSGSSALPPPRKGQSAGKTEALWAVRLAANLWKKQIWTDSKTVSLLALACFHPHPRVQSSAVRFFLGDLHSAEDDAEASDSDDQGPDVDAMLHARKVKKKTRSGDKKMRAAAAMSKKKKKAKAENAIDGNGKDTGNFAALYLLNDPQNFGEKLFDNLSRGDREKRHTIDIKIRLMQLLSRVMGAHKLCVLSFYSYVVKYLAPHQQHITHILVSLAQSVHDQTPPDVIIPVVRKLSDAFVHPGVSSEVVAAGINSIREICRRQPWAMEDTLLEDLISYRRSKDKGVCAASRGLLALYREVNPALLKKKERGKMGSLAVQQGQTATPFGVDQQEVHGIQGIHLLEKHLEQEEKRKAVGETTADDQADAEDKGWEGWEEESDGHDGSDDESEDGWINVSSDDEDGVLRLSDSDSDDDDETRKHKRTVKERLILAREKRHKLRVKAQRKAERKVRRDAGEADVVTSDSESDQDEKDQDADAIDEDGSDADDNDDAKSTISGVAAGSSEITKQLAQEEQHISTLATTKILTPADFAKLTELRIAAAEEAIAQGGLAGNRAKRQLEELKSLKRTTSFAAGSGFLDEGDILGPRKKAKATYEDRMASIEKGREDREKYGSKKGKKNKEKESSSTNREKQKTKNFQMIQRSWSVRSKKNASLREKSRKLRKHIDNAKKRIK
ncbi:related to SDA1 - required for normal organization of the actin cytoskeleton; required for passage through Start [Melanopsichium pennsylvanicum]|uniref:Protein SDA1 n=2 Tax=Melanopsichium pennsylvanicum TaxID=63383 RepID=A0AAJ4XT62_9BASI|nr:related to SDA1-required for normal organization of the actin cytoskeleton [Melanopsichium pennsylvanicum 4]SNX87997.1 related to SDA1 - required for normal organization of the actin cytoskeleton; required for passage through Start [Melanopsichium pennsylvanicum]